MANIPTKLLSRKILRWRFCDLSIDINFLNISKNVVKSYLDWSSINDRPHNTDFKVN